MPQNSEMRLRLVINPSRDERDKKKKNRCCPFEPTKCSRFIIIVWNESQPFKWITHLDYMCVSCHYTLSPACAPTTDSFTKKVTRTESKKVCAVNEIDRTDYKLSAGQLNGAKRSSVDDGDKQFRDRSAINSFMENVDGGVDGMETRNSQKVIFIHNVLWMRHVFDGISVFFSPSFTSSSFFFRFL